MKHTMELQVNRFCYTALSPHRVSVLQLTVQRQLIYVIYWPLSQNILHHNELYRIRLNCLFLNHAGAAGLSIYLLLKPHCIQSVHVLKQIVLLCFKCRDNIWNFLHAPQVVSPIINAYQQRGQKSVIL